MSNPTETNTKQQEQTLGDRAFKAKRELYVIAGEIVDVNDDNSNGTKLRRRKFGTGNRQKSECYESRKDAKEPRSEQEGVLSTRGEQDSNEKTNFVGTATAQDSGTNSKYVSNGVVPELDCPSALVRGLYLAATSGVISFKVVPDLVAFVTGAQVKPVIPQPAIASYTEACISKHKVLDESLRTLYDQLLVASIDDYDAYVANTVLNFIRSAVKTDPRDKSKVVYELTTTVLVILLAKIQGCNTAPEIAAYAKRNKFQLQFLLPDLADSDISPTTINSILKKINIEELQLLVRQSYSADVVNLLKMVDLKLQRKRPDNLRVTVAADGQEGLSSFREELSRLCKAIINVTLFDCTHKLVLASMATGAKNQEAKAILKLAPLVCLKGTVFMCDALNTRPEVLDAVMDRGADTLCPVKGNGGNKKLSKHLEETFAVECHDPRCIKLTHVEDKNGRYDVSIIEVLPVELFDANLVGRYKGIKSIVRYTKISIKKRRRKTYVPIISQRYYICSLPFSQANAEQILWSILDYWSIEQHHSRLDDPRVFDQDAIQSNNMHYLGNVHCINKIAFNFLSWFRVEHFDKNTRRDPLTFSNVKGHLQQMPVFLVLAYLAEFLELVHPPDLTKAA